MTYTNFIASVSDPYFQLTFFSILLLLNIALIIAYFLLRRKINFFLQGKNAKNLEESINNLINDTALLHLNLGKISQEQGKQAETISTTIRKVGIVRFNPFNNTGGDQSFAIAFLNSENSGIIISSLFLREGTRIYAKPINKLKSSYSLSKEEEEAIKKATDSVN